MLRKTLLEHPAKAHLVLDVMAERMAPLGKGWADVTATQVYTVFDIHSYLADEFVHSERGRLRQPQSVHHDSHLC